MPPWLEAAALSLGGHYWTLRPFIGRELLTQLRLAPPAIAGTPARGAAPAAQRWSGQVDDPRLGPLRLTGLLQVPSAASTLLLAVHGLGGSADSPYLEGAAVAAAAAGWACLRLNMRGADGSGEDFYHAALTADLHAALASPELAAFSDVCVIGYSLGGHLALRLASEPHDARVRAVAAVCSPLDLARGLLAIDSPRARPYRDYVLRRLKAAYVEVARRRPVPSPLEAVLRARSLREWDALTVVPRHGFASPEDYYARASVAGRLGGLRVPALLVNTEHDPMVPAAVVRPALVAPAPLLDVRWLRRGGHVGFPADIDLGQDARRGLEPQVLSWLGRAAPGIESSA